MANFTVKNSLSFFLSKYIRHVRSFSISCSLGSKKVPEEALPKNLLDTFLDSQPYGEIYDKRPFRIVLKANKKYAWCSCGHSKSQPLCDGTHRIHSLQISNKPIFFMVKETKEYWLCNCKHSEHRPFCDGTHENEEIQTKLKFYKN